MCALFRNIGYSICRNCLKRSFQTTPVMTTLWEREERGGYGEKSKMPHLKERMREGLKELKNEIALWSEEVKERFDNDPILIYRPGEVDVQWQFGTEESLKKWLVSNDSDNNEGFSHSSLGLTKGGKALFSGNINLRVPKDGRVKRAGYCNLKSLRARKSFKRDSYLNWALYNMLIIKVRGDGRSYLLNIHTKGYFDVTWNDMYHYVLFTRGGPYWQVARIPFSKFYFGSKGRIQDKQEPIPLDRVASFGITAGERYGGNFNLEIDYIGVEFDPNHREEFAYEMYRTASGISNT